MKVNNIPPTQTDVKFDERYESRYMDDPGKTFRLSLNDQELIPDEIFDPATSEEIAEFKSVSLADFRPLHDELNKLIAQTRAELIAIGRIKK